MDRPTQFGHLVALDICNELLTLCQEAHDRHKAKARRLMAKASRKRNRAA